MSPFSQEHRRFLRRMLAVSLVFSLSFAVLSVTGLMVVKGESKRITYSIKSTVTYVNPDGGTRTWNLTEGDRTIGLFMNNSWQGVELKDTTRPVEVVKMDTDENSVAVLKFPRTQLLPGENLSYAAEYLIVSRPRAIPDVSGDQSGTLEDIPKGLKDDYTRAEGSWLIRDPTLVMLAHEIAGNETNVLNIVESFVGWIREHVSYTTHEFPFYPNETLSAREGDCDDQAILLITLSRIMGIPSYLQIGSIYMPGNELTEETLWDDHVRIVQRKIGWHGWAMEYVPPWGWLPVDLTYISAGGFADPLSAIRYGAVAGQDTVQYMNFSKTDYVLASRETRTFIVENGFFIESEDQMTEVPQNDSLNWLNPLTVVALGVATTMLLVGSLLVARRWRRRLEKPEIPAQPSG